VTFINTKMLTDVSTRSAYEQLLMVASPPIEGFDKTLEAARSKHREQLRGLLHEDPQTGIFLIHEEQDHEHQDGLINRAQIMGGR